MNVIRSICIVGGGTSAWLSAAYLSHNNPDVEVTVVDEKESKPIAVGEGTILGFSSFMEQCGFFDTGEWFSELDATYKVGVLFPDWATENKSVWHPFMTNVTLDTGVSNVDAWCKNKSYDFVEYALPMYHNSMENKIDTNEGSSYSYHIDCGKLVSYIKRRSRVRHIQSGYDSSIKADLFIDCTGFKSILKKNDKNDLTGRLFCDTAIATKVPYQNRSKELRPYTTCTAVDHGWIWRIPVRTRMGSGLVFNRNITPIDEAKEYFLNYWDHRISEDDLRVIDWTSSYSNNIWEGNVVSIGLSAGFIEPLESTGLALIQDGLRKLQDKISDKTWTSDDVLIYNKQMKIAFEDCIDFVSMHYSKSYKDTPFWNYVRETYVPSERIKTVENILKEELLYFRHQKPDAIFPGSNWVTWMIQLGYDVNTSIDFDSKMLEDSLIRNHERVEKFRSSWSVDHESHIKRIEMYNGINCYTTA